MGAAVVNDANGNVVVTGYSTDPTGNQVCAMWRFLPSGSPDPSFGTNGAVVIASAATFACGAITGVVADAAGGVLIAGGGNQQSSSRAFAARFTSAGAADPTFGFNGFAVLEPDDGWAYGLAVDSKGRIVVAGAVNSADRSVAVWRLSSGGVVDATFGDQGFFSMTSTAGASPGLDQGNAIAVDAQDRPVIAGISESIHGSYLAVWRLTP
jgi:uncharacterized delta-60 repeat protein